MDNWMRSVNPRIPVTALLVVLLLGVSGCDRGIAASLEDTDRHDSAFFDNRDSETAADVDANASATHDICKDIGDMLGMGTAIFGDTGTRWAEDRAAEPDNVDWHYGYMYTSGDPREDISGFEWIVNHRLDTAQRMGASMPTVTFYRMLNIGRSRGYTGSEARIVQQMLTDKEAMHAYLNDFVTVLEILNTRPTPTLLHVEPDSFGFMMWAFDGIDSSTGNPDATSVAVNLSGARHPALDALTVGDHAAGLGLAMIYLRNRYAPAVRLGWHASNFRVGTHPEVVTSFFSHMGSWDVILTEPPHMVEDGSDDWDLSEPDNAANLNWFRTVSETTGLPILMWQVYVDDVDSFLGAWPNRQSNLTALVENGLAGILWDPNGNGGDCAYTCAGATRLSAYLSAYSAAPLMFPARHLCGQSRSAGD